ncbi:hypothetical protein BH10ACI1_BH10ACI1_01030 [soil metagenome]
MEIEELQTEPPVITKKEEAAPPAKQTWKEWFGTEDAVRWVYLVFGFFAIFMLMTLLQFSTNAICCGDWDGYYHIRWSSELWNSFKGGHWLPEFKWLPLTVLSPQKYADHHFLFHVLQIPFLWFFEPVMAAKIAAIFYGSLAIFSIYWLLFKYKVNYLLLWFFAILTCANPFYYRMNMAKAPPLTIIFSVIGIYLLFERKYVWLLPVMFAFVWTYSLFPLLWIAAVIWTLIIVWNERRFEWRPFVYTTAGMILGNVINPYFPRNIWLFLEHFWTKVKIGTSFAVPVGGEWYPYSGQDLLTHFPIALLAMLAGYILFRPHIHKLPEKATFFLCFVTILLLSQFRSIRFSEYFPPFAILFVAFSWQAFFVTEKPELPEDFKRDIEPLLDKDKKTEKQATYDILKQAAVWFIGIALILLMYYNFRGIKIGSLEQEGMITSISNNEDNTKYKAATDWMKANIPEGERIFNCNWDDFPKLFYFDTKHTYVYGLDPNYLYSENPDLYKLLNDITSGKTEDAAPVIREKFGARFVFADAKENEDMFAKLLESGWAEIVFEDTEARILKIRDVKGTPPKDSDDESDLSPAEKKILDDAEKSINAPNVNLDEDNEEEAK